MPTVHQHVGSNDPMRLSTCGHSFALRFIHLMIRVNRFISTHHNNETTRKIFMPRAIALRRTNT